MNRTKISSISNNAIYERISKSQILEFWHGHHDMKIVDTSSVDWEINQLARNRFSKGYRRFYIKYVTGQIGNQHMLHHQKQASSPRCPNCHHPEERSSHPPRCSHMEACENTLKLIKINVEPVLEENNIFKPLCDAILNILDLWCRQEHIHTNLFDSIFGLRDAI